MLRLTPLLLCPEDASPFLAMLAFSQFLEQEKLVLTSGPLYLLVFLA